MFCPNCGAQQQDGTRFCDQCGAPLPAAAPAPAPTYNPPPAPPTPPEDAAPPPEPPRKRGAGLVIAAVAVFAVVAMIAAAVLLFLPSRDKEEDEPEPAASSSSANALEEPNDSSEPAEPAEYDMDDYLGDWHVPSFDGETSGVVFTISNRGDTYYIESDAFYRSGNRLNTIDPVPLTLEEDKATAIYTEDARGNHGKITLRLLDDGIRATVTSEGGDWGIVVNHEQLERGLYASDTSAPASEEPVNEPAPSAAQDDVQTQLVSGFENYLFGLITAINNGDFSAVSSTMVPGSSIYNQQKKLVDNLHGRGIRESVETYYVESSERITDTCWHLSMYESISVLYSDGTSKLVEQHFTYVMEQQANGAWLVSDLFKTN